MLLFWPDALRAKSGQTLVALTTWLVLSFVFLCSVVDCMSVEEILLLQQESRDIFYYGFDSYMKFAFPEDELRPLSCTPLTRDRTNPAHIEVNDVLGNYSLTLIDSLSTLAILASTPSPSETPDKALKDFQNGVASLVEQYGDGTNGSGGQGLRARGFDIDSKVQVFETVIRGVGGLLSAHQFAVGDLPIRGYETTIERKGDREGILWENGMLYDGQLLRLAEDLGKRLLPAFFTPTGLPYPRVNLRDGVPFYANSPLNKNDENGQCAKTPSSSAEITETCSAGAGSLVLEFSTLSRLTGNIEYEKAAKEAFWAVWNRKSGSGLIGSGIDAETGQWISPYTGIGAGIDSFFEYAFKSHILLSGLNYEAEDEDFDSSEAFLETWVDAHESINRHIRRGANHQHPHYIQADLYTGALRAFWIDSLSAYYPGLLTLAGELDEAIVSHLLYTALWSRYSALPERWSTITGSVESELRWWGGRPEFIESTWYLYRATRDPWYLHVGEMALRDIKRRCWTKCGWAGLQDVRSGEQSDRMESFFLGETAKYLFLLFDSTHPLNTWDAPFVFTTEGHPLIIPQRIRGRSKSRASKRSADLVDLKCPAPPPAVPFTVSATAARGDVFHAASLARLHLIPTKETLESPLVEFNADHPSISISDLHSPSNYTYYPWTLPLDLVPANGTSLKMASRSTFDLTFPNSPDTPFSLGALQRVADGIVVKSTSGLRFGMIREGYSPLSHGDLYGLDDVYRIQSVLNMALGRDEKIYMSRDLVSTFNPVDPYFTRSRDIQSIDVLIDAPAATDPPQLGVDIKKQIKNLLLSQDPNKTLLVRGLDEEGTVPFEPDADFDSLQIDQLLAELGIEEGSSSESAQAPKAGQKGQPVRSRLTAALPSGPGAAPIPDVEDSPLAHSKTKSLPFRTIFIADELCDTRLPLSVPKEHQVIVIKRGGCSFSHKLSNIPSYVPSPSSLQLVVVVSYPEHSDPERQTESSSKHKKGSTAREGPLIQPFLDVAQQTASGLPRPHPISMAMVGGGDSTLRMLRRAAKGGGGVGIRRRWHFLSQGLKIGNLIIL